MITDQEKEVILNIIDDPEICNKVMLINDNYVECGMPEHDPLSRKCKDHTPRLRGKSMNGKTQR